MRLRLQLNILFPEYLVPVLSGSFDDYRDVFLVMERVVITFYNFSIDGIFESFCLANCGLEIV